MIVATAWKYTQSLVKCVETSIRHASAGAAFVPAGGSACGLSDPAVTLTLTGSPKPGQKGRTCPSAAVALVGDSACASSEQVTKLSLTLWQGWRKKIQKVYTFSFAAIAPVGCSACVSSGQMNELSLLQDWRNHPKKCVRVHPR